MGVLVMSSLVYKRHRESPKRPWRIWLFDISKQVLGQLVVHGVNVLISDLVAHAADGNACVFYFLNILVDTTIGVGVIYLVLHLTTWLLAEKCGLKGFESGQYGTPPSFVYWLKQATVYVFSLMTMKLLVVALFAVWPGVFKIGEWLLDFLGPSDEIQVIFTMGLFPIMMNIIQFWLIDSIVKSSQAASVALPALTPRSSIDADAEPLFRASLSSEEDDDDGRSPRYDIENPHPQSRSHSRDDIPPTPSDEPKSFSSGTATVTGSGSTTPAPKAIDIAVAPALHAYPPSLVGSSSSASASPRSSIRTKSTSPRPWRRRTRSPPLAVPLRPLSPPGNGEQPSISQTLSEAERRQQLVQGQAVDEKEWTAWGEEGDDWADRAGEDWTEPPLDTRKTEVDNVWTRQGGVVGL